MATKPLPRKPGRQRPLTCTNTNPHVKELFRLINETDFKFAALTADAGFHISTVYDWGRRQTPNVANLEAMLNQLGYTLQIVKIEEPK